MGLRSVEVISAYIAPLLADNGTHEADGPQVYGEYLLWPGPGWLWRCGGLYLLAQSVPAFCGRLFAAFARSARDSCLSVQGGK